MLYSFIERSDGVTPIGPFVSRYVVTTLFDKFKAQSKIALRLFLKAGETNGDLGSFRGAVLRMLCARQVTPAWKV